MFRWKVSSVFVQVKMGIKYLSRAHFNRCYMIAKSLGQAEIKFRCSALILCAFSLVKTARISLTTSQSSYGHTIKDFLSIFSADACIQVHVHTFDIDIL